MIAIYYESYHRIILPSENITTGKVCHRRNLPSEIYNRNFMVDEFKGIGWKYKQKLLSIDYGLIIKVIDCIGSDYHSYWLYGIR
jgi:hypothetical protein